MRWLIAALLLTSVAAPVVAGGTCVGPVWINTAATDHAYNGPDFTVTQIATDYGDVSIYEGCCSQVSNDEKVLLFRKDGEEIYRTSNGQVFTGYLTEQIQWINGTDWHHQAHFFGSGLKGDDRDLKFFDRVRLGSAAEKICQTVERG